MSNQNQSTRLPDLYIVRCWGSKSTEFHDWLNQNYWFLEEVCLKEYGNETALRNAQITSLYLLKKENKLIDDKIGQTFKITGVRIVEIAHLTTRKAYSELRERLKPKTAYEIWMEGYELDKLNISSGLQTKLMRAEIIKIDKLCVLTKKDILQIRGIGQDSLAQIEAALARIGREFKKNI